MYSHCSNVGLYSQAYVNWMITMSRNLKVLYIANDDMCSK